MIALGQPRGVVSVLGAQIAVVGVNKLKKRGNRVAIATRIYRPEPAAAVFRIGALVDELSAEGISVNVLTTRHRGYLPTEPILPANVRVSGWPVVRNRDGYVRGYVSYLSFDIPLFFRLLATKRPAVIVVEPPPTSGAVTRLVSRIRKLPYVAYLPDLWADGTAATNAPRLVKLVVRLLERFSLRGAAAVVASTPEIARRAEELHGVPAERVKVVRNGIDTDIFSPNGPLHRDAPRGPYAIYAGTASEWQGADILIAAWAQVIAKVPNATLIFLGQGHQRAAMETHIRSLPDGGASVRLLPRVPAAEAASWLRGASASLCTMVPDSGYDYFLPTKVFAGAACGTPVLYSGPGPAAQLVSDNNLGLAVPFDVTAVANALVDLLQTPVDEQQRQYRAHWAQEYASLKRVGKQTAKIVLEAAEV